MTKKPIAKVAERRTCLRRWVSRHLDRTGLPKIINEALNACRVGARHALVTPISGTFALVYPECLDGFIIDIGNIKTSGFQPSAKVNGRAQEEVDC
jgi:hypothetical protein